MTTKPEGAETRPVDLDVEAISTASTGALWPQWLEKQHRVRRRRGVERETRVRGEKAAKVGVAETSIGARHNGIDLVSNDYLGLARNPEVIAAAIAALRREGASASASPVVAGTRQTHLDLEAALTELTGQQSAVVFSSGYLANIGAITALADRRCLVLLDEHVHASIHDATGLNATGLAITRLTGRRASCQRFRHNDLQAVAAALANRSQERALVVVESIYSVLGDAAPLAELAALCSRHHAMLLIDESHGIGVAGQGRGGAFAAGLAGAEHIVLSTSFGKSLASQGGAVLGSTAVRRQIVNTSRTFIYDTALAPAAAAAAATACQLIHNHPELNHELHTRIGLLSSGLQIKRAEGAVQSLPFADISTAQAIVAAAEKEGLLLGLFRPGSSPDGRARIRLTAHAGLSLSDLAKAITVIRRLCRGMYQGSDEN